MVALLALLDVGPPAWGVGLACAVVLAVAAGRRATVDGVAALGPADLVTLTRATLACGIAALVAEAFAGADVVGVLVPLTVVALLLDLVDGRVARRTGTASAYGARLDGEADAFLILVLSVLVAREHGAWVLGLGVIRYAYAVAARLLPVDAAAVAAALLAQGGGGLRRHRPDARGVRPRTGSDDVRRAGGRGAAARGVVRLGRGVAVAASTEPGGRRGRTPCKGPRTRQVSGMRVIAALSVLVSAAVHLYLWLDFARDDDFLGPSFMLNAIAGAVIAVLLLVWRHWVPAFLALGFGASTLLAFVLATTVGLFGVTANWTGWAVWVAAAAEVVAIVAGARLLAADNPLASRVQS